MSNFTDFFPAAGGGGGGIPKYQDFTSSGTFTPTQALIDAGGRLTYFIVGGGTQGSSSDYGGAGGGVEYGYMTLTSINSCIVTLGAPGGSSGAGGNSIVAFSSAGGIDITANGGQKQYASFGSMRSQGLGASWANAKDASAWRASAGNGVLGYAAGGASGPNDIWGGVAVARANSGQGAPYNVVAGAGFIRLTWFE